MQATVVLGRKYVVYKEDKGSEPVCDGGGAISTFTYLNFLVSSISLAGLLMSNNNDNNNNNNNNNNDNNNNVASEMILQNSICKNA